MNNKGFTMVGKKGHSFPMVQSDPVEEQKKKIMEQQGLIKPENRAGSALGNNVLVNNPNNPQPMNKVSASVQGREQMFNNMASSPGVDLPQTPAPVFPGQQGSFAAYSNPKRVSEDLSNVDVDAEGGLKGMMDKFRKKRNTKVGDPVTPKEVKNSENPPQGDSEKTKSIQVGKSSDGQSYVGGSSGMYDSGQTHTMPDGTVMPGKSHSSSMYDGLNLTEKQEDNLNPNLKAAIEEKEAEGTAMHKAPGMHEKHTQISKANVNAAMRDDAAHASYLKRDINYDNRHGGSKKQMTADEKHISKLAGDIKYDVKKKRKYDNV